MTSARRRAWPLILILAIAGLTGCSSSPPTSTPSLNEVTALLNRHGAAVLNQSRAAFLHDVDSASAARAFRDRQSAQIGALSQVPLASWTYAVQASVSDAGATKAAKQRYGAPALIVQITLSYALRAVDPVASVHSLWWTFVRRHGRVVVAGDDDMAQLGGASWRGPWDFGALVVRRGAHSLVLAHPGDAGELPGIAGAVDAAVPVVSSVWGGGWTQQVAVLVPASGAEFEALTGQAEQLVDVSAETIADQRDVVTGAVTGQRVVVNPATLDRLTGLGRRIVLQHEITHVATAAATSDAMPRWLVEGFADYVGNLHSSQPVPVAAAELRADVRSGQLPARLPADVDFAPGSVRLAQAYEASWLACRLIAQRADQAGLVRFYRLVGDSAQPPDAAVATALRTVLHESTAAFTSQWRAYLRTELA